MSCTDYLVFQTQEPADMKCRKAQSTETWSWSSTLC